MSRPVVPTGPKYTKEQNAYLGTSIHATGLADRKTWKAVNVEKNRTFISNGDSDKALKTFWLPTTSCPLGQYQRSAAEVYLRGALPLLQKKTIPEAAKKMDSIYSCGVPFFIKLLTPSPKEWAAAQTEAQDKLDKDVKERAQREADRQARENTTREAKRKKKSRRKHRSSMDTTSDDTMAKLYRETLELHGGAACDPDVKKRLLAIFQNDEEKADVTPTALGITGDTAQNDSGSDGESGISSKDSEH